jgi:hypothetical protein
VSSEKKRLPNWVSFETDRVRTVQSLKVDVDDAHYTNPHTYLSGKFYKLVPAANHDEGFEWIYVDHEDVPPSSVACYVDEVDPRRRGFERLKIANKYELLMQKVAIGKAHVHNRPKVFPFLPVIVELQEIEDECSSNAISPIRKKRQAGSTSMERPAKRRRVNPQDEPATSNDEKIVVSGCCIEAKGNKRRRINPPVSAEGIAIIAETCSCYVGGKHRELLIFPPVDFGASWMSSGKSGVVLQQEMLLEYEPDLVEEEEEQSFESDELAVELQTERVEEYDADLVEEEEEQSFESDEPAVELHTELAEDTGEHEPTSDETLLGSGYRREPQGRIIRFSLRVRATK